MTCSSLDQVSELGPRHLEPGSHGSTQFYGDDSSLTVVSGLTPMSTLHTPPSMSEQGCPGLPGHLHFLQPVHPMSCAASHLPEEAGLAGDTERTQQAPGSRQRPLGHEVT